MYTLVTDNNFAVYKDYLEEIESFYFGHDPEYLAEAIKDGGVSFLLYDHNKLGLIGGAKITHPDQDHLVNQYFKDMGYIIEDCWVLEDVFFHIPDENPIHDDEDRFLAVCEDFYTGLYEVIQLYGQDNRKSAFITLNSSDEHEDIKHFGEWPFIAEHTMSAEDQEDDLVMGLLPISQAARATA
jgi:hypothetical protein